MRKTIALALGFSLGAMAAIKIEKTEYKGWPNSYRISNGEIELIITSDIGPRIMRNATSNSVELAAWALSMMAQNGVGIHGFPPRGTHPQVLAPTNPLVMWAFTDLSDNRWKFTKRYLILRQDPNNHGQPQKLGSF